MTDTNDHTVALDPFQRALFSARYTCGSLSILVGSITMLATVVDQRTRSRVDADREKGEPFLWAAREVMETVLLDYTSILVARIMDTRRRVLSIPGFCTALGRPGVTSQIIKISRQEHGSNDGFDESVVRKRLKQIVRVKDITLTSHEFACVKKFRNHRAAHVTFDDYGMSVMHLMTTYFHLVTIGNHFQKIFGSRVYEDDYWDLEPTYRKAAAALWQLDPAVDPILFKGRVIFRTRNADA